jgi:Heavy-metal resistance
MQALAILVAGGIVVVALWSWLAGGDGRVGSRRGGRTADQGPLGLRSPREILEAREQLEAEDLTQLLEACNARRRRRGEPERTIEDVERSLAREQHDPWRAV